MKKIVLRVIAVIVIVAIILSPYLLVIDFKRFSPFVFMIWLLSVAYWLLMRRRVQAIIDERNREDSPDEPGNSEEEKSDE